MRRHLRFVCFSCSPSYTFTLLPYRSDVKEVTINGGEGISFVLYVFPVLHLTPSLYYPIGVMPRKSQSTEEKESPSWKKGSPGRQRMDAIIEEERAKIQASTVLQEEHYPVSIPSSQVPLIY